MPFTHPRSPRYLLFILFTAACQRTVADYRALQNGDAGGGITLTGTLGDGGESPMYSARATIKISLVGLSPATTSYRLANEPSFTGAAFAPLPPAGQPVEWQLGVGEGSKIVYAQFRTSAGHVSATASAGIVLDTEPPEWQKLAVDALDINQAGVGLTYLGRDREAPDAALMQVGFAQSADVACDQMTYGPYGDGHTAFALTAPVSGQSYTIVGCLKDRAGNTTRSVADASSAGISSTVRFDSSVPSAPVLNAPIALAGAATLFWDDANANTAYVAIDYSPDAGFATFNTATTDQSRCKLRDTVAQTLTIAPLANFQTWYFRARAVNCAGTSSEPSNAVSGLVGVSERAFSALTNTSLSLFSDGPDLWAHYPTTVGGLRGEALMHCRAGSVDCRRSDRWTTISVQTAGYSYVSHEYAAMFADPFTLFLAVSDHDGGLNGQLTLVWCDKSSDCEQAGNWSAPITVRTIPQATPANNMFLFGAAVTNHALYLGYVIKNSLDAHNPNWNPGVLAFSRCARTNVSSGPGPACREATAWSNIDTTLPVDASAWNFFGQVTQRPTIYGSDDGLFIGTRLAPQATFANGTTPAYASALIRCRGLCTAPTDFTSDTFAGTSTGDGPVPQFTSLGDSVYWVWQRLKITPPMTVSSDLAVARCRRSTGCDSTSQFSAPVVIGGEPWSDPLAMLKQSLVGVTPGIASVAQDHVLRLTYDDPSAKQIWIASCDAGARDCGAQGQWSKSLLISGGGSDAPMSVASVGQNLYVATATPDDHPRIILPRVPTPYAFMAGPQMDGVTLSWMAAEDSAGTSIDYGLGAGGPFNTVPLGDPSLSALSLTCEAPVYASARTLGSGNMGSGDVTVPWTAAPFSRVPAVVSGLAQGNTVSVDASPAGSDLHTAVLVPDASAPEPTKQGGIALARCADAGACANAGNWNFTALGGAKDWLSLQIGVDVPRDWYWQTPISGRPARALIAGGRGLPHDPAVDGTHQEEIIGCAPDEDASACAGTWSAGGTLLAQAFLDSSGNPAMPAVNLTGDFAIAAMIKQTTPGSTATLAVSTCDGAPPTRDRCAAKTRGAFTQASDERASGYCLDPAHWSTAALVTNGLTEYAASALPGYGYMVVQDQSSGGDGLKALFCPYYQIPSGACALTRTNCGDPTKWTELRLPVEHSFYTNITGISVAASAKNYQPLASGSDRQLAAFVSYCHANKFWVASCRDDFDPDYGAAWPCASRVLKPGLACSTPDCFDNGWASVPVAPTLNLSCAASTVRIVNGDVVATLFDSGRLVTAICPRGEACSRQDAWRVMETQGNVFSGSLVVIAPSPMFAPDRNGALLLALPNISLLSASRLDMLSGGRFQASPFSGP